MAVRVAAEKPIVGARVISVHMVADRRPTLVLHGSVRLCSRRADA